MCTPFQGPKRLQLSDYATVNCCQLKTLLLSAAPKTATALQPPALDGLFVGTTTAPLHLAAMIEV